MRVSASEMEAVALALCGEPNVALSKPGRVLRFRQRGSLCVDVVMGGFRDFEAGASGGLLDLVVHMGEARDRRDAWKWVQNFLGGSDLRPERRSATATASPHQENVARARTLFQSARPIPGTPAELYLRGRAIAPPFPFALRFHPRVFNAETKTALPAIVSAVTPLDAPTEINAIQRTYLTRTGNKAAVSTAKKTLGSVLSGGVILARFTDALLVGEGIETTMSASASLSIPGVATLGTSGMKRLNVPTTVRRVVIAYDVDSSGAGRHAAEHLARRLWAQGVEVQFARPPGNFNDWNEAAQARAKRHKD